MSHALQLSKAGQIPLFINPRIGYAQPIQELGMHSMVQGPSLLQRFFYIYHHLEHKSSSIKNIASPHHVPPVPLVTHALIHVWGLGMKTSGAGMDQSMVSLYGFWMTSLAQSLLVLNQLTSELDQLHFQEMMSNFL